MGIPLGRQGWGVVNADHEMSADVVSPQDIMRVANMLLRLPKPEIASHQERKFQVFL
jgi:hypothetical protein